MYKNALIIAALLHSGSEDFADAIQIAANKKYNDFDDLLDTTSEVGGTSPSCTAGIKRMTDGKSNSWIAFKNAIHDKSKWTDSDFTGDDTSLFWKGWGQESAAYTPPAGLHWIRPADMGAGGRFSSNPSLWGSLNKPVPNGVSQNQLGDCWFLAAASAVAENPERIYRITWNKSYNKKGAFRFYFWIKNGWYGVNIDDRLPSKKSGSNYRPWGTFPSTQGAWWMPLLEKAYAKLDQDYDRLVGGWGQEGLRTLTGMPTTNIQLGSSKKASLLPMHKYFAGKNYPMTSGCCHSGGVYGLISGHAYSLLDVKEIQDDSGTKHTLAKMRNPWNQEHYKGPWRDSDPKWTAAMKKEVNLQKANDGIFWMNYDDYIKYFYNTGVAMYDKYAAYDVQNVKPTKKYATYEIDNPTDQIWYLTAEQYSKRHYPRATKCKLNANAYIGLFDNNWTSVGSWQGLQSAGFGTVGSTDKPLKAGKYKLYVLNNTPKTQLDMALNTYWMKSKGKVTLTSEWN